MMKLCFILAGLILASTILHADENAIEIQQVTEQVYALVGKRGPMTEKDLGTNATFGVIVTSSSVVLVDPGASFKGAKRLHDKIREITDKHVTHVINTGSEDQRWLGNGYFKQKGAQIIALKAAVEDQQARTNQMLTRLSFLLKESGAAGTDAVYADQVFEKEHTFNVGGIKIVLQYLGTAYTPGDIIVWLPENSVLFSGDIITVERMPAIGSMSNTSNWIDAIQQILTINPRYIVPGHGHVADINKVNQEILAYLVSLRKSVSAMIAEGGDLSEVSEIDQSAFKHLIGFEMLRGRNAHQVYQELEWQ